MATLGVSDYMLHITYGIQGVVIFFSNGLLLLTILHESSHRSRKEMLIIAGLAGADVIYGFGAIWLPIYRFVLFSRAEHNDLVSAWDCIMLPPISIMNIGLQLSSVMSVVVSIDRLIAVVWPTKYHNMSTVNAGKVLVSVLLLATVERGCKSMQAFVTVFGITSLASMFLTTYFDTSRVPSITKMCGSSALSFSYNIYQMVLIAGSGYASVSIYFCVYIAYRRAIRQQVANNAKNEERAMLQQRRLTVTLGIITLSTFCLFIVPFTYFAVCALMLVVPFQSVLLGAISRFSTIISVAIYVFRQKEMRRAMWALITCKKATPSAMVVPRLDGAAFQ